MHEDEKTQLKNGIYLAGRSLMMFKTPQDFCGLVKTEFGYIWDGKGWIKEVWF